MFLFRVACLFVVFLFVCMFVVTFGMSNIQGRELHLSDFLFENNV